MNDPRITAYAVGELEPAEREAFETELAASNELQRELAETVALIDALPAELRDEESALPDIQRDALAREFRTACQPLEPDLRPRPIWRVLAWGAAAVLVVGFLLTLSVPAVNNALVKGQMVASRADSSPKAETAPNAEFEALTAPRYATADTASAPDGRATETPALPAQGRSESLADAPLSPSTRLAPARPPASEPIAKARAVFPPAAPEVAIASTAIDQLVKQSASVEMETLAAGSAPAERAGYFGGEARSRQVDPPISGGFSPADHNTETYDAITPNGFLDVPGNPLSTFSIDVDTASYANMRRFLNEGRIPPAGAIRLEELINYFPYDLPQPEDGAPFSITTDVTKAPWNPQHLLARIALKGRDIAAENLPASNLVFLVDVSGSMRPEAKLPLLKRALRGLVDRLRPQDSVAIVTYAGSSGLVLEPTEGNDKPKVLVALERLESGGSTNGASGIQLAYDTAREHFLEEGNNRVILCTDGDFNVGTTSQSELVELIENERKSGVFLSVLGFGTGNVKDSTMEKLADKGNGNYAYIDSPAEARKVLVEQMGATLFTIAKDVKVQVEFNPATVAGYRLIGYENRLLAKEDFNDDTKDAGEIGAGHSVTALYEIVPAGQKLPEDRSVDPLKYQPAPLAATAAPASKDLFTVKLRYKSPDGDTSQLIEKPVGNEIVELDAAPADFRFASAVAGFGMKLRGEDINLDWNTVQQIARGSLGSDPGSYRAEFLTLVEKAKPLMDEQSRDAGQRVIKRP